MTRLAAIDRLRHRLSQFSFDSSFITGSGNLKFGVAEIDHLLPGHGLGCGGLHEFEGDYDAITVFLAALMSRNPRQQQVLWITPDHQPSASDLARQGLDHRRLTIAWTRRHADRLWAMDQSLRDLGYGAVVGEFDSLDTADMQRLAQAAERSSSVGLVIRRNTPHASTPLTRWHIDTARSDGRHTWLQVGLTQSRNRRTGSWLLEWNPAERNFRLLADLKQSVSAAAE